MFGSRKTFFSQKLFIFSATIFFPDVVRPKLSAEAVARSEKSEVQIPPKTDEPDVETPRYNF